MFKLYTDGGCWPNPGGVGGWAWVLVERGRVVAQDSGSVPDSTNNRMELMAAIQGLESEATLSLRRVVSDSRYLVDGASSWINRWRKNNWQRKKKKLLVPVKNADLWQRLDLVLDRAAGWEWVRGHSGNRWNELADELASEAAGRLVQGPEVFHHYQPEELLLGDEHLRAIQREEQA